MTVIMRPALTVGERKLPQSAPPAVPAETRELAKPVAPGDARHKICASILAARPSWLWPIGESAVTHPSSAPTAATKIVELANEVNQTSAP